MKKSHAAAGALALVAGVLSVVLGTAASATPGCVADVRSNTSGVTLTAGGKATPTANGLQLETTVVEDGVVWKRALDAPVPLKFVTELSYRTRKLDNGAANAAALPAYRLYLEGMDGPNETTTLVYEPYWQITGNPALDTTVTWDVDAGTKWWSTKTVAGLTAGSGGPPFATLAQVVAGHPNARVVAYGIGQGTYNAGTKALANEVRFRTAGSCTVTTWTAPAASSSSASQSASATASSSSSKPPTSSSSSVSASATATAAGSASTSGTPAPIFNAGNRLPTTDGGTVIPYIAGAGGLLLLAGAGLLVWLRRRNRDEFAA